MGYDTDEKLRQVTERREARRLTREQQDLENARKMVQQTILRAAEGALLVQENTGPKYKQSAAKEWQEFEEEQGRLRRNREGEAARKAKEEEEKRAAKEAAEAEAKEAVEKATRASLESITERIAARA